MMYQFKREDAMSFANFTGIKHWTKGDELIFLYCPYCKRTEQDNQKKFSINLNTGQFECKRSSCGAKGNMITIARDFDFKLSDDFSRYYERKKSYKQLKQLQKPPVPTEPALEYLQSRGISRETADAYHITTRTDNPDILVFPIYDENGKMVNVKYRNTRYVKGETRGSKEWFQTGCVPYLYGIQTWNGSTDRMILCEGQMDCMSVHESDVQNAFSVPGGAKGFTWWPPSYDFVSKFSEIIIFGDYENGKITLLEEMKQRFSGIVRHVREDDYLDCKDANEILQKYGKEQVKKCIDNAVLLPVKDVVDLAEVEDVDISQLEKLPTGIKRLDKLLYGGLPFGGVHLIGGRTGTGKSTLASMFLVNAVEHGYTCFAYSGELPNYLFKAWMSFQVAGRNHVFEKTNQWQETIYGISESNKKLISEWYRGKIYIFDNSVMDGNDETANLVEIVRRVIQQYGARVILLDNLMTAMTMEKVSGEDQYERQTDFMNKLRSIAVRYNVMILLVAHKRKAVAAIDENDEFAGSSNIANLAMLTVTFSRVEKKNNDEQDDNYENTRILRVPKNRLFGKVETDGYYLEYDERSRRICDPVTIGQKDDEFEREFGWIPETTERDGFIEIDDTEAVFD